MQLKCLVKQQSHKTFFISQVWSYRLLRQAMTSLLLQNRRGFTRYVLCVHIKGQVEIYDDFVKDLTCLKYC